MLEMGRDERDGERGRRRCGLALLLCQNKCIVKGRAGVFTARRLSSEREVVSASFQE